MKDLYTILAGEKYKYQRFCGDFKISESATLQEGLLAMANSITRVNKMVQTQLETGYIYINHPIHYAIENPKVVGVELRSFVIRDLEYHSVQLNLFLFVE